jgi:hypothetical protein
MTNSVTNGYATNSISLNNLLPENVTLLTDAISETDREMALSLIAQLRNQLPLRNLKASDRQSLAGMGDQNRVFTIKVLDIVNQHPDFLPPTFNVDKLRQSLTTFERLESILTALNQLRDLVDATAISVGSEAYNQARVAYRYAKASDQGANLEGIVEEMGQRYSRKSKKAKVTEASESQPS